MRTSISRIAVALAICASLAACGERSPHPARPLSAASASPSATSAARLDASVEPLRGAFNRLRRSPRLLAVLSSGCPRCREGAVVATGPARRARPDLQVILVWMDVLPLDAGARKRLETFHDPAAVTQFVDPGQFAGRLVAERLGWPPGTLAYDVFLLYEAETAWEEALPMPATWFHQRRRWADPERYRTEEGLARALAAAARAL